MKKGLFLSYDSDYHDYKKLLYDPIFHKIKKNGIFIDCCRIGSFNDEWNPFDTVIPYQKCLFKKIYSFWKYFKIIEKQLGSGYDFIISRSLIPSLFLILQSKNLKNVPIIFDCDGFMHLERSENKIYKQTNLFFYAFCLIEQRIINRASAILVRTKAAARIIINKYRLNEKKVFLMINGRNHNIFFPKKKYKKKIFRLIYIGSIGPQYMLDEMIKIYSFLKKKLINVNFYVYCANLSCLDKKTVYKILQHRIILKKKNHHEMPKYIRKADLAFNLRKHAFSTKAVFPIKISEYLLSGVPVLSSKHIGDFDMMKMSGECFKTIGPISHSTLEDVLKWSKNIRNHRTRISKICRAVGLKKFTTDISGTQLIDAIRSTEK